MDFLTNMIRVPVSIFTINEQMMWSYLILVINMTISHVKSGISSTFRQRSAVLFFTIYHM